MSFHEYLSKKELAIENLIKEACSPELGYIETLVILRHNLHKFKVFQNTSGCKIARMFEEIIYAIQDSKEE